MTEIATTKRQRDIIAHSINLQGRIQARKKGKLWDDDAFRNYYCANFGGESAAEIMKLVEMGLMRIGPTINDGKAFYAYVTPLGIKEVMP